MDGEEGTVVEVTITVDVETELLESSELEKNRRVMIKMPNPPNAVVIRATMNGWSFTN